jgi:hypothetical protein
MLDIIAEGEEIGLDQDTLYALQDFHEYALGEIASNIKESKEVSWGTAYDKAWEIITGAKEVEIKTPGILEVPEDKHITSLSLKDLKSLAQKKGIGAISRTLKNLVRWNEEKKPELSKWSNAALTKLTDWADNNPDELSTKADLFDPYAPQPVSPPQPAPAPTIPIDPGLVKPALPGPPEVPGPSPGSCLCSQCGYNAPHEAGISCASLTCPTCNIQLVKTEGPPLTTNYPPDEITPPQSY